MTTPRILHQPLLAAAFPSLAQELFSALAELGETALAEQVGRLRVLGRCTCDQTNCGTFYTQPEARRRGRHQRQVRPRIHGLEAIDIADGDIVCVEFLDRADIVDFLNHLAPSASRSSLPSAINMWDREHDPWGYLYFDDWGDRVPKVALLLRLDHVSADLSIHVGYEGDMLVVSLARADSPIVRTEVECASDVVGIIDGLITTHA